ncbi:MAG TPA: amidohydrolase family protein [archaeon]|nr:amidohydrolase family protein [archaeon]
MPGSDSVYRELREKIAGMRVIDTHEHTKSERFRREEPFSPLALGYVGCDLCGAGASDPEMEAVENADKDPARAREVFLKYYPCTRTTGYGRSIARTLRGVFDIETLDERTYDLLWEKIRTGITPGFYERWFPEKLNIRAVILDSDNDEEYPGLFFHSLRQGKYFVLADSREDLEDLERKSGLSIHSAAQMRDAMWSYLEKLLISKPVVALKNPLAYNRSIYFERTTLADADRAFSLLFARKHAHHAASWIKTHHRSPDELLHLQNFLVHETVRFATEFNLAYQVHTGLQAGHSNEITDSRPTLLLNLFREYRKVPFVLFHGGFPYCREWGVLGRNFPNVYLDLCWMHIISPATCVQMLDEWLDYVPNNKIFGFGGDLHMAESVYGHLEQARDNIARALAVKVTRGDYDRKTALEIAENMLYHNPRRVFRLPLDEA